MGLSKQEALRSLLIFGARPPPHPALFMRTGLEALKGLGFPALTTTELAMAAGVAGLDPTGPMAGGAQSMVDKIQQALNKPQ